MNKPLISVILPIYNVKDYLDKCMDSVINQSYENLEIIMVDDGSTDGCSELCDTYLEKDVRIVVYHKTNGGLSDARNYGISRATGEYITCIDSDDFVDSDYVEYLFSLIKKHGTKMSICQHRVCYTSGKITENGIVGDELLNAKDCIEKMLYHEVIDTSAWAKLYKKELFEGIEYPKGKLFEDIATTYKLMLASGDIAVGYESKYNYIWRENSITNCSFNPKRLEYLEMTDNMVDEVVGKYSELQSAGLRRKAYARFNTLNQMLDLKDKKLLLVRKDIVKYLKNNRKTVCKDKRTPKRDRIAFNSLRFGVGMYRLFWKTYKKIRH